MKSAVTISLIKEARGGPFVYWEDLPGSIAKAAALGFDAVEIFAPSGQAIAPQVVAPLLQQHNLKLAAVGTGGGWVLHKLTLTHSDAGVRKQAKEFIKSIIDAGGALGAPAIIGSMQGRWGEAVDRETAMQYLTEALADLCYHAKQYKVPVLFEPLNRYETNLVNTVGEGLRLLELATDGKLLIDLFHANIEEPNIADSILHARSDIGHVHLADSNRRAATMGHLDFDAIGKTLFDIDYQGYASAECLAYPNSDVAAQETITAFRKYFMMTKENRWK